MKTIIRNFIADVFNAHCQGCHNADFEVCRVLVCRIAHWLERGG